MATQEMTTSSQIISARFLPGKQTVGFQAEKEDIVKKINAKWIIIHFPEIIAGIALVFAITISGITAVTRYAFDYVYGGADELTVIAFAWTTFLGAAAAFRQKMHYGVDLVVALLPENSKKIFAILAQFLILVIMVCGTFLSLKLTLNVGTKAYNYTMISYAVSDTAMVLAFALMTIYSAVFLVQDIKAISINQGSKEV